MKATDSSPLTNADAMAVLCALADPLDWTPYYRFSGNDHFRGDFRRLQAQFSSAQIPGLFEWLHGRRNTVTCAFTTRGSYSVQERRRFLFSRVYIVGAVTSSPPFFSRHPQSFTRLDDAQAACHHYDATGNWA